MIIYQAFVEAELDVPRQLARRVHDLYFQPTHEDFAPRTMWSLSNAFTSAFKELAPVSQFWATGHLAKFLGRVGVGDGGPMLDVPEPFRNDAGGAV